MNDRPQGKLGWKDLRQVRLKFLAMLETRFQQGLAEHWPLKVHRLQQGPGDQGSPLPMGLNGKPTQAGVGWTIGRMRYTEQACSAPQSTLRSRSN